MSTNIKRKSLGGIELQSGNGVPDHSAPLGSQYVDLDTGIEYKNTDGGTTWEATGDITRVGEGINTFTGGTANNPTVNVTGMSIDNITVSGESSFQAISAVTFYSGSTDLSDLIGSGGGGGGDITRVGNGTNTFTGGTVNNPTVNVTGLTIDNITVSGSASANTFSADTIVSGTTDLSEIFAPIASSGSSTRTYDFDFALSEDVTVTNLYFFSWKANGGLRSGAVNGLSLNNNCSPIMAPFSGTITEATIVARGTGVNAGSVTYPCNYNVQLYKVGFAAEGSFDTVNFPITSATTVGTNSVGVSDLLLTVTGLSISVDQGDMMALKFSGNTTFGDSDHVAYSRMAFVKFKLEED